MLYNYSDDKSTNKLVHKKILNVRKKYFFKSMVINCFSGLRTVWENTTENKNK